MSGRRAPRLRSACAEAFVTIRATCGGAAVGAMRIFSRRGFGASSASRQGQSVAGRRKTHARQRFRQLASFVGRCPPTSGRQGMARAFGQCLGTSMQALRSSVLAQTPYPLLLLLRCCGYAPQPLYASSRIRAFQRVYCWLLWGHYSGRLRATACCRPLPKCRTRWAFRRSSCESLSLLLALLALSVAPPVLSRVVALIQLASCMRVWLPSVVWAALSPYSLNRSSPFRGVARRPVGYPLWLLGALRLAFAACLARYCIPALRIGCGACPGKIERVLGVGKKGTVSLYIPGSPKHDISMIVG